MLFMHQLMNFLSTPFETTFGAELAALATSGILGMVLTSMRKSPKD